MSVFDATTHQELTPATQEEAAPMLTECSQQGQRMRIVGGGTKQNLGNPAASTDVTISTLKLDDLVDYQPEDLTITVGAGMTFARLQAILGAQGQFLPLDPPELQGQTMGGILATNRSGPRRLLYGTARDLLIGCRFVLADGSSGHSGGRVVKNVAGYDLHKLFIGSYGTLGLLTEVTFKVVPLPQVVGAGKAVFSSLETACAAARQCARSNLMPSALQVERESEGAFGLWFGAEGVGVAVEGQLSGLAEICRQAGATSVEILSDGSAVLQKLANWDKAHSATARIGLKATAILTDLPRLAALLEKLGRVVVQAGTGVIYTTVVPGSPVELSSQIERVRAEVEKLGGSLTLETAPPEIKQRVDAWGALGDALPSMQALKRQLDPQGLLNPGRLDLGLVTAQV